MQFSFFLCVFLTAFVFVQCYDLNHRKGIDYTMLTKIDCQSVRRGVIGTMMNSTCKPHYRHVPLNPMPSQELNPSVVSVKRCDGNCPERSCVPIETEMIKVAVKLIEHHKNGRKNSMCALVEVEQHNQCRCIQNFG